MEQALDQGCGHKSLSGEGLVFPLKTFFNELFFSLDKGLTISMIIFVLMICE